MTIKELERKINQLRARPLVLLCRTPDGAEREMSVQECMETGSAFIHIVMGNDMDELDALLAYELKGAEAYDEQF